MTLHFLGRGLGVSLQGRLDGNLPLLASTYTIGKEGEGKAAFVCDWMGGEE